MHDRGPDAEETRHLGMQRKIYRRDFLQGLSVGLGGLSLAACHLHLNRPQAGTTLADNPSSFQGQDETAKELGHLVRDGRHHHHAEGQTTGEHYDLIVVGAGLSGLTAAYTFQRERQGKAKILILDNYGEIAGHARRNVFTYQGQTYICHGGSFALEDPEKSPEAVVSLWQELGLDLEVLAGFRDADFAKRFQLSSALLCDPQTLPAASKLAWLTGFHTSPYETFFSRAPLPPPLQQELITFYTTKQDFLPEVEDKEGYLKSVTWKEFILKHMCLSPAILPFANLYATDLCGLGADAISAWEAAKIGPGFLGMGGEGFIEKEGVPTYAYNPQFRFPDGNHSVARLLLKQLKPEAMSLGASMAEVFGGSILYQAFDRPNDAVRIRLRAMVVEVKHSRDHKQVAVDYMLANHKRYRVTADGVIMAAWGSVAKHILPELGLGQKAALERYGYTSAIYTNILLKSWQPLAAIGANALYLPDGFCTWMSLADPLHVGPYKPIYHPDHPIILSLFQYLYSPKQAPRDQMRWGRMQLEATSFQTLEWQIRSELNRLLGPWGFDARKHIAGMIVNRWAHGYNFFKSPIGSLGEKAAYGQGKCRLGKISFAGADSGGEPWLQTAMLEAIRAAREQLELA